MNSPVVLAFNAYYVPGYKAGGPIRTLVNMTDGLGDAFNFFVVTSDRDLGDSTPYKNVEIDGWVNVGKARVKYVSPGQATFLNIAKVVREISPDVIYLNSFFNVKFTQRVLCLRFFKIIPPSPIVLAPRGEFSDGALNLKAVKKKIFLAIFKAFGLQKRIVFQASSDFEAEDIRRTLGAGVDVRVAGNIGAQDFIRSVSARGEGPLKVVFLSRISPMKNLLSALEMLRHVRSPLCYHIYGPIEDKGYWQQCESVIESLPAHIRVEYRGSLKPEQVLSTLSNYDTFFLPTKGENYGHAIAEALRAGLPVLIADTTPWRNLQKPGVGWDLPLKDPEAFSSVLDYLASLPVEEHLRLRETVLAWARKKFSQSDIIESNASMFRYAHQKQ